MWMGLFFIFLHIYTNVAQIVKKLTSSRELLAHGLEGLNLFDRTDVGNLCCVSNTGLFV